jgi:septum formation protein
MISASEPAPTPRLVLASASPYRRELIARLRLPVIAQASSFDEEAAKPALSALPVDERVRHLARGKAIALAALFPDALIIGSDQAAEIDGEMLGKPGTEALARAQLERLAGREHRLLTAVAVHQPSTGRTEEALDVHRLTLRPLAEHEIARYVALDRPLDCAGAYKIESLGIALFASIVGDDFTAIVGLPLLRLVELLARFGVRVLDPR